MQRVVEIEDFFLLKATLGQLSAEVVATKPGVLDETSGIFQAIFVATKTGIQRKKNVKL